MAFFVFLGFIKCYDICPCHIYVNRNPGCCCHGLGNRSNWPSDCYPAYPPSVFPSCPSSHFQTTKKLDSWVVEELFCTKVDWRVESKGIYVDTQYSTSTDASFVQNYTNDQYQESNLPNNVIYSSGNVELKLPGAGLSTICTDSLSIPFLKVLKNQKCYQENPKTVLDFRNMLSSIISHYNSSDIIPLYIQTDSADIDIVTEAYLTFSYSPDSFYSLTNLSVTLVAIDISQVQDFSPLTINVNYIEQGEALTIQSGNIGYSSNYPIIAASWGNDGTNDFIIYDESNPNFTFPIPYGNQCNSVFSTPLNFGSDTLGGCIDGSMGDYYRNLKWISKFGHANPNHRDDWILIDTSKCENKNRFMYTFYTEKRGTVQAPYSVITDVKLTCSQSGSAFTVVTTFIETSQTIIRNIGSFPFFFFKMPDDFFYPWK